MRDEVASHILFLAFSFSWTSGLAEGTPKPYLELQEKCSLPFPPQMASNPRYHNVASETTSAIGVDYRMEELKVTSSAPLLQFNPNRLL